MPKTFLSILDVLPITHCIIIIIIIVIIINDIHHNIILSKYILLLYIIIIIIIIIKSGFNTNWFFSLKINIKIKTI